jgi:hypothetical protein
VLDTAKVVRSDGDPMAAGLDGGTGSGIMRTASASKSMPLPAFLRRLAVRASTR